MDPVVIGAIGAVVVAVLAYLFVFRKKEAPELPAAPEPKKLPEKKSAKEAAPKAKERPSERPEKKTSKPAPARDEADDEDDDDAPVDVDEGPAVSSPPPSPVSRRDKDVDGLRKGLSRARDKDGFFGRLKALFTGKKEIDPAIVEQMEEVLLSCDVGVNTTEALLSEIRDGLEKNELSNTDRVWEALRKQVLSILSVGGGALALSAKPTVVMVVGVNGAGKTTTIGKLATKLHAEGKVVVLAAGDTFRAAAVQQLKIWGKRVGCEVVSGKDGQNPGAVIFDAIKRAEEIGADVVLADTAGRLHTKSNLMDELQKVARTMTKAMAGAPHETLLVLDATNGQNALQQAAMFKETLPLSGIVLTKLDGTAKGGVILGICDEHKLPVRYIGIGERPDDLRDFIPEEFVEAMLGGAGTADQAAE